MRCILRLGVVVHPYPNPHGTSLSPHGHSMAWGTLVYLPLASCVSPALYLHGASPSLQILVDMHLHFPCLMVTPSPFPHPFPSTGLTLSAIGDFLGWISGFIYLASRVPQIYQTFVTKHVEDLSIVLFACAVLGNSTYAASILTHSLNSEWLRKQAPFLLGSMGTLAFDAILVYQIVAYGTPTAKASPEIGDNH